MNATIQAEYKIQVRNFIRKAWILKGIVIYKKNYNLNIILSYSTVHTIDIGNVYTAAIITESL